MYKLGDDVDFKIRPGRGRPQHGRILEIRESDMVIITPQGGRYDVPKDKIKEYPDGLHVTRYSPRQKRLL